MFPVGEAIFLARKYRFFESTASIKQKLQLCRILIEAYFIAEGGVQLWRYDAENGGDG